MLHGGCGGTVELQLEQVEFAESLHHHIHTAGRGTYLDINVAAKQGEYHIKHLLVMALVVSVLAIRHGEQELLQLAEHAVKAIKAQGAINLRDAYQPRFSYAALHIIWQEAFHQTDADLVVRYIKGIKAAYRVVALYGEVTALVEQWQHGG